jgi:hypothetical protein
MKFTVREVSDKDITVDFPDGTWAVVPAPNRPLTRAELCEWVLEFNPQQATWEVLPFEIGETVSFEAEISDTHPEDKSKLAQDMLTYGQMRKELYPEVRDQLDALYWARHGKPEQLAEIDAAIDEVKQTIPKGLKSMTRAQFAKYLIDDEAK